MEDCCTTACCDTICDAGDGRVPAVHQVPSISTEQERERERVRYFFTSVLMTLLRNGIDVNEAADVAIKLTETYKSL